MSDTAAIAVLLLVMTSGGILVGWHAGRAYEILWGGMGQQERNSRKEGVR